MAYTQTNTYKNQRREINKTLTRQGMFIAEYIQSKYKDFYREAAMMYNELNKQYPRKPDLRKTQEFRLWKNKMAKANGESPVPVPREKKYMYKRTIYWDIMLDDAETTPAPKDQTPSITNGRTIVVIYRHLRGVRGLIFVPAVIIPRILHVILISCTNMTS